MTEWGPLALCYGLHRPFPRAAAFSYADLNMWASIHLFTVLSSFRQPGPNRIMNQVNLASVRSTALCREPSVSVLVYYCIYAIWTLAQFCPAWTRSSLLSIQGQTWPDQTLSCSRVSDWTVKEEYPCPVARRLGTKAASHMRRRN